MSWRVVELLLWLTITIGSMYSQYQFQLLQSQIHSNSHISRDPSLRRLARSLSHHHHRSSTRLSQFQFKREIFFFLTTAVNKPLKPFRYYYYVSVIISGTECFLLDRCCCCWFDHHEKNEAKMYGKEVTSFCLFHVFICAINRNEYHLRIGILETGQTVDIQSTIASMRMRLHTPNDSIEIFETTFALTKKFLFRCQCAFANDQFSMLRIFFWMETTNKKPHVAMCTLCKRPLIHRRNQLEQQKTTF